MRPGLLSTHLLAIVFCVAWLPCRVWCAEPCAHAPPTHHAAGQVQPECGTPVRSGNSIVSPFLVFAAVVAVTFPVLWLFAWIRNRKQLRPGKNRSDQDWPVIRKRYLAVIDESFERRQAVIAELAQALGSSSSSIQARLAREGIYKAHKQ